MNYYNEIDPGAAAWLRELIADGQIPAGYVDERSIEDVRPNELMGYTQCHFFAGIGGWSLALRLAGIPDSYRIWTGSCPCQPFSAAGAGAGVDDPRHLWPHFAWLIRQCRPAKVAGEQVASKSGRSWFAGVRADLEALGYAVAGADLCAAGVGAPHIRQRLFWMADADGGQRDRRADAEKREFDGAQTGRIKSDSFARDDRTLGGLADSDNEGLERHGRPVWQYGEGGRQEQDGYGSASGFWNEGKYVPCADGKARRIEPGIEPLAHGIPARVVRLRGYGNAIVPQVAAEFLKAALI